MATHTVQKGDTLTAISKKYYKDCGYNDYNSYMNHLVDINNIANKDLIYVGQVLQLTGDSSSSTDTIWWNDQKHYGGVTITHFGLSAKSTRTVFVMWDWDFANKTEKYEVNWHYYDSTTKTWILGSESSTSSGNIKYASYDAPDNAEAVKVKVRPVAKKYISTGWGSEPTERLYYSTVAWTKEQHYWFKDNPPGKPEKPTVTIEKASLTVKLTDINIFENGAEGVRRIEFWVIKEDGTYDEDNPKPYLDQKVTLILNRATWTFNVDAGFDYTVKCRGLLEDPDGTWSKAGDWSDYSEQVSALPTSPEIVSVDVLSETTVSITFKKVSNAKSYKIYYVKKSDVVEANMTKELYFNTLGANITERSLDNNQIAEKEGLLTTQGIEIGGKENSGDEFYIRMCSNNGTDDSDFSNIVTFSIGVTPTSPTSWSSTTSAVTGETLKLYWLHNSEDSSVSNQAVLAIKVYNKDKVVVCPSDSSKEFEEFIINLLYGENYVEDIKTFNGVWLFKVNKSDPEERSDKTYVCDVNTLHPLFSSGYSFDWKVKTAGVKTDDNGDLEYGKYSTVKTVDVYTAPVFSHMNLLNKDNESLSTKSLTSFPLHINAQLSSMTNQKPTGYYLNILATARYTTVDTVGNTKVVTRDTKVLSKYYDYTTETFDIQITAADVDFVDDQTYKVVLTASMDSGLTATSENTFKVAWIEQLPTPMAEVNIDRETVSASIIPYIELPEDSDDTVYLSVYRREYDGSYTPISDTEVGNYVSVKDPHPALDFARYRIVARSSNTGAISYNDLPGVPTGEIAVVIQWDEKWQVFDTTTGDAMVSQPWTGSLLKLPYNITVSKSHNPDVSLVQYIGRKRPVGYYGTQLGETDTWSVAIPKDDTETLYGIRRLASWMGDVYVREPSGLGYWANIKVSYSRSYSDLTIPISFSVTPVEGGK